MRARMLLVLPAAALVAQCVQVVRAPHWKYQPLELLTRDDSYGYCIRDGRDCDNAAEINRQIYAAWLCPHGTLEDFPSPIAVSRATRR